MLFDYLYCYLIKIKIKKLKSSIYMTVFYNGFFSI